ncbi:f-box lrr-repeat protein 2 isoform 1 [Lynx pardinus]|uniref:F-box lrr-repeat protein 2 isoform 1 n=1 Tax=Lynx pardinus TaxID=191816 RepID=A0A485MMW1_LYNPA|nr:f-box lrr-repeat protein 2 isoform 1 [Lynx pardinus]
MVFSNNDEGLINKKLPKELLLRIFSFLDIVTLCRCAQISKAWNILALDGSNWQRIDLFNFQTDVEGRVVENISKRCGGFLRKLSLRGCIGVGDSSLKTLGRTLSLVDLSITPMYVSRDCPAFSYSCLIALARISSTVLNRNNENRHPSQFMTLGRRHPNMVLVLDFFADDHQIGEIFLLFLGTAVLRTVPEAEVCQQKKVKSVHHKVCFLLLTSHYLFLPCTSHPRILEAARCSHLTDAGFTLLARNCHDLEKMDLEECVLITDSTLIQLSVHCPKLQALVQVQLDVDSSELGTGLSGVPLGDRDPSLQRSEEAVTTGGKAPQTQNFGKRLLCLTLYDCQQVTRAGIKRMRAQLPHVKVHAYFAPVTPPTAVGGSGQRLCRCCVIL